MESLWTGIPIFLIKKVVITSTSKKSKINQ